jgi:hypothetical protein
MRITINCNQCNGEGYTVDPTGNCRNNSNECCGGCDKNIHCDHCNGVGEIEVEVNDYFENEVNDLLEAVDVLKIKGVSLGEVINIIKQI